MGPQDYPTSPDQPDQPAQGSASQWFNSLPSDQPPLEPATADSPAHKSKKPIIIAVGLAGLLVLGSTVAILFALNAAAAPCLTITDYKALTGNDFEDPAAFSPRDSFYTTTAAFENGSAKFAEGTENAAQSEIKKLGAFYTERADSRPMIVTVSADYTDNDTKEASTQRIALLAKRLESSGIDPSVIKQAEPKRIISGEELSEDSAELMQATAYVSVNSVSSCR